MEEFAALHAPVADLTWEVTDALPRTALEGARLPLSFARPCEILGCYPSVIRNSGVGGALLVPTVDDILVLLDVNEEERLTNRLEQGGQSTQGVSYVTLSAISTAREGGARLIRKKLTNAKPEVGVQFRWKRFISGTPLYEDALVSLAFFVRWLKPGEVR